MRSLRLAECLDGSDAYVTCGHSVTVIDAGNEEMAAVVTGGLPRGLRLTCEEKCCYITDLGAGTVSSVDTSPHALTATVVVGGCLEAMAVSANGDRLLRLRLLERHCGTVISTPTVQDWLKDPGPGPDARRDLD